MIRKAFVLECDVKGCDSREIRVQNRDEELIPETWIVIDSEASASSPFRVERRCICLKHLELKV